MRAGAGRIVSGRLSSELTSGEEGGGEEAGDDVWTDMDADTAGGGVDAGCCWLERRYLDLGWGFLAFGARCGMSTTISTSSSESSASAGSGGGATRRRCLRGLVVGVYILCRFPFLRGDTRGVTGVSLFEATVVACLRGRLAGDVTTTSTLPLSLKVSARASLRSRRVLPLATGGT